MLLRRKEERCLLNPLIHITIEEMRDSESDKKPCAIRTLFFLVLLDWNWRENRNRKWRAFD